MYVSGGQLAGRMFTVLRPNIRHDRGVTWEEHHRELQRRASAVVRHFRLFDNILSLRLHFTYLYGQVSFLPSKQNFVKEKKSSLICEDVKLFKCNFHTFVVDVFPVIVINTVAWSGWCQVDLQEHPFMGITTLGLLFFHRSTTNIGYLWKILCLETAVQKNVFNRKRLKIYYEHALSLKTMVKLRSWSWLMSGQDQNSEKGS